MRTETIIRIAIATTNPSKARGPEEAAARIVACGREGGHIVIVGGGEVRSVSSKGFAAMHTNGSIIAIFPVLKVAI